MATTKTMPAKWGVDYVRGSDGEPIKKTKAGWARFARSRMPASLKKARFNVSIFVGDNYYRINYGK